MPVRLLENHCRGKKRCLLSRKPLSRVLQQLQLSWFVFVVLLKTFKSVSEPGVAVGRFVIKSLIAKCGHDGAS